MGQWKFEQKHYCLFATSSLQHRLSLIFSTEAASSPSLTDNNWTEAEDGALLEWVEGSDEKCRLWESANTDRPHAHEHTVIAHIRRAREHLWTQHVWDALSWRLRDLSLLFEESCWGCWHTPIVNNRASLLSFPVIRWLFHDWPARQRLQVQKQWHLIGSAGAGAVKGQSWSVRSETRLYICLMGEGTQRDCCLCCCCCCNNPSVSLAASGSNAATF